MYSQMYSALYEKFGFEHFEIIAETLEKHFPTLFNLQVIDNLVKNSVTTGSYIEFFTECMNHFATLYTSEEIISKIYELLLRDQKIRDCFLEKMIFVPELDAHPSAQLAFLEKTATGELKVAEPVTFLDMLRVTYNLQNKPMRNQIAVLNLDSIQATEAKDLKSNNRALMINFNREVKGTAKWGVVDLTKGHPRVYCETPLLESEKKELEEKLDFKFEEVSAGKADSLPSTGYTAIAWLDQNITKFWNFETSNDFNALLSSYVMAQFRGDSGGIKYGFSKNELDKYVSKELRHVMTTYDDDMYKDKWQGYATIKLASIAMLGEIDGKKIPMNDLAKVIEVMGRDKLRKSAFSDYVATAYRSNIPRFAHTMGDMKNPQILWEDEATLKLVIPQKIDKGVLRDTHSTSCRKTNTNPALFKFISKNQSEYDFTEQDAASTMVLTIFRTRAKKREISIDLPAHFQLSREDIQFITDSMQDNAYVTEFKINKNRSLEAVKEPLLPVFARNRWLAECGYRPPMVDNYWHRAAKYWLLHISQQTTLLADRREHDVFKRCVSEMGLKGLEALLHLLQDEESREFVDSLFGKNKPAFYAACQPHEVKRYLDLLLGHLNLHAAFPFSELGVSYQPYSDAKYIELINQINHSEQFERLVLADCLRDPDAFKDFLNKLTKEAHTQKWVGLIVVPELEDKTAVSESHRVLRAIYDNLNNVILRNRHLRTAEPIIAKIKAVSKFTDEKPVKNEGPRAAKRQPFEVISIENVYRDIDRHKDKKWPLKRGGVVQLQLQQQQQIVQNRQIQQEQQKIHMQVLEEIISGECVTYKNIDALLGSFYKKFAEENVCDPRHAALIQRDESLLQGFFRTWINAEPTVNASHVIRSITLDAAKMMLRNQARFTSGLSLENLPKGFYTQRAKDGSLILCHNPELGFINGSNPFTVMLGLKAPKAEAWEGDFRLLDDKYLGNTAELDETDFHNMVLFAMLQPQRNYEEEYKTFCQSNPKAKQVIGLDGKKVTDNWLVFLQAWKVEGIKGVAKFLDIPTNKLYLNQTDANTLFFKNQSLPMQEWIARSNFTKEHLRAIGQVFYRYGNDVMTLLLQKFRQMDNILGHAFFEQFNANVLSHSTNYDCFISERFFEAMDDMIATLRTEKAAGTRHVWLVISEKHMNTVHWENIESLWRAFEYFHAEITELGLELAGDEFDKIAPENMLVSMDRILETLKRIPGQAEKARFLRNLPSMQLTHGGVHYAIQHEGFRYFDQDLELANFRLGSPTYAPDLLKLYGWSKDQSHINMLRTLASRSQFSHQDYQFLADQLGKADVEAKNKLVLLLFTQYDARNVPAELEKISKLDPAFVDQIAHILHNIVYKQKNNQVQVSLDALVALANEYSINPVNASQKLMQLSQKYPHGTYLEAMNIVHKTNRWKQDIPRLVGFFDAPNDPSIDCPDYLFRDSYKISVLFGRFDVMEVQQLQAAIAKTSPVVKNELRLLINQILSIDYDISDLPKLLNPQNCLDLLKCVESMQADRAHTAKYRIELIDKLTSQGIYFKYSKSGEFRTIKDTAEDRPESMGFFVDHQARLWQFMLDHIAVPSNGDAKEALLPIVQFFKRLQMNRTYLNEIEPLLATLEKTKKGELWTASYFYQMLKALQPEDQQTSFPISLIKVVLNDVTLGAKSIDSVEREFPQLLITPLQAILKNTIFNRAQQSVLCELALKEYGWQKANKLLGDIIQLLTPEDRAESRSYALKILATSKNIQELENRIEKTRWLLEHGNHHEVVNNNWTKTTALWLKALSARQSEDELFTKIRNLNAISEDKQALILHIIAWSSLHQGLRDKETWEYELSKLAPKLIDRLVGMADDELEQIAACFPNQPSPGADDILRILKNRKNPLLTLAACIDDFLRNPHTEPRMDYRVVAKTREADLQRMLGETRITKGQEKLALEAPQMARISLVFAELKQLQAGTAFVTGYTKPVEHMTRAELADAFQKISQRAAARPDDDRLRAQVWAILFQGLSHTTRKYPHLAQQFALIANDICVEADTSVLRLATGEGKSHFVALRAAKHAGMGKIVDICTAKRTLAERDLEDYQGFFNFFGLTSSYIHPLSAHDTYQSTQIHYSTTGDLSLFMDEQNFAGHPINIEPEKRVGLFDEYDFIRFEEGRKTEYNYARPTGRTPKQMTWFYQAINRFYVENSQQILRARGEITTDTLKHAAAVLQKIAGEDEEKQSLVNSLLRDPLQLVRWLQSAHEAHDLTFGIGFTVREENIVVGDTSYPMREIIPLSSDNQKMAGSTFSAGVQQLLAVRLNTEARIKNEPQNYHIHPESNIISSQVASQRMKQLWGHWEGFSGTISASQSETLHEQHGTEVLHVTTNQYDLRTWHQRGFYQNKSKRLDALVQQIRLCLEQKQSMLFSCKNDAQVLQLKTDLKDLLTEDELASFIFYTNEDELSANEVLSKKQNLEKWQGGQKQQAIGLIASGFGRGDNVGVEAVFLFDVNDINDLLQKGGRTARNGEEGEVFQFYLTNELIEEEQRLYEVLQNTKGVAIEPLRAILEKVEGNNDEEKIFERVMLLREYVFSLQNAANQGYHEGLAQLSSWGMGLISLFIDPIQAQEFVTSVTLAIKTLDKAWIDISSNSKLTVDEKIRAIEEMIGKEATRLQELCHEALKDTVGEILPLRLRPYPDIKLKIVLETNTATSPTGKDLSIICTAMACLPISVKDEPLLRQIPELLNELAGNALLLGLFSKQIRECQSISEFYSELNFSVQKIRKPSLGFRAIEKSVTQAFAADDLLEDVSPEVRKLFVNALLHLNSEIAEEIIKSLGNPGILSNEQRVQATIPVVEYLSRFTEKQQSQWGMEYASNLDKLIREEPSKLVLMFSGKAMSYRHINSLWQLVSQHTGSHDLPKSMDLFQHALGDAPEQRMRMLGRAEILATFVEAKDAPEFLKNFSTVMSQFTEGKDWDVFVKLVEKTQSFWNKDRAGQNRQELLLLWRRMANNATQLPALGDIFRDSFALDNKQWFEFLSSYMAFPPQFIVENKLLLQTILMHVMQLDRPKAERLDLFNPLIQALPKRQNMVSLENFNTILDLAPSIDFVNEFLGFEIALPASVQATTSLETREAFNCKVLTCLKTHNFFTTMSASERQQCLAAFNRLISRLENVVDINLSVSIQLENFDRFLTLLAKDVKMEPSSLSFAQGACWYLDFITNNPSEAVNKTLQTLIAELPHGLRIHNIVEEFARHTPTESEAERLIHLAVQEGLTGIEFSNSCQNMSAFNMLLKQTNSFGAKEAEELHDKLLDLEAVKLRNLNALITGFHSEIKANPSVLEIILDYGHSHLSEPLLLFVAELLLQTVGQKPLGAERIENIKQGIDGLMHVGAREFFDGCQQRVNFDRLLAEITIYDDAVKNQLWNQLHALPLEKIAVLLTAIEQFRSEVQANPGVISLLITIAGNPGEWAHHQFLAELILKTVGKKTQSDSQIANLKQNFNKLLVIKNSVYIFDFNASGQYLANAYALITNCVQFDVIEKSKLHQRLDTLPSNKFLMMLELISKHAIEINANPRLLQIMLGYGENHATSVEQMKLLTSILFSAASGKPVSEEATRHLEEGMSRYINKDAETLSRLRDLIERNPERAEELLFDNVAAYLENYVHDGERNKVKGVVDFFYELALKERGTPDLMFNFEEKRLQEMFDFDNRQQDRRDQRIIWMHMLHHGAFVTGKKRGADQDGHHYQWDRQQNEQLLQSGLNLYVARCEQVLKDKPPADTDLNRDLSISQQSELLQLSDELSIIGESALTLPAPENSRKMKDSLDKLIANYDASWFKTEARKRQIGYLKDVINDIFAEGDMSRYQQVYSTINEMRIAAMSGDEEYNATRFLKLNRGGQSRYLNTLNQMQDTVLRYWTQDAQSLQSFQVYRELSKTEFFDITRKLTTALRINDKENHQTFAERHGMKKLSNFFMTTATCDKHAALYRKLRVFNQENNVEHISKEDLETLLVDLRADMSILPGHVQTIVKDVLNRGDALAIHVGQETAHTARKVLV